MLTQFFNKRTIRGFYLPLVGSLLSLAASIIYLSAYTGTNYFNIAAFLLPLFSALGFIGLILFPITEKYASLCLELLSFLGFLFFLHASYLYLSTVFYDGVTLQAIKSINPCFVLTILFELIAIVFGNIGIYVSPRKGEEMEKSLKEEN